MIVAVREYACGDTGRNSMEKEPETMNAPFRGLSVGESNAAAPRLSGEKETKLWHDENVETQKVRSTT